MRWRAYPKYKPSGIDWLGNIPAEWQSKRLKYCVSRINEKVDGRESDLPYTGLEHIESWTGRLLPSEETPTSEGQSSCFKPGDVLFGKLRPYLAKVLRATADGICTGELLVLRPNQVTQDYLFNYMLARDFVAIVDSSTYGAKMPRANWEFIGNLPMLLPPQDEQRAITAVLDRETERLDALIARKERQIELLQEKRAALISHAVTKGLDPDAPMKDSGVEWLGEIPAHWEVGSVRRYFSVELGKMLNRSTEDGSGIMKPYIRAANVHWSGVELDISGVNEMEFSPNQLDRYRLQPGDLLVTEGGVTVGRSTIWNGELDECYYQNSLNRVICLPGSPVSAKFLYYWMYFTKINGYVDLLAGKATFGHLTNVMLKDFLMPAPGGLEQHAITQFLDRKTAEIDTLVVKVQESIDILKEYRTALISAAVTGRIQVQRTSEVRCT